MRKLARLLLILVLLASQALAADGPTDSRLHELRPNAEVSKLGVVESYNEAIELEKEVAQLYREIRATKLSRIQRQSISQSLRQTLLPISERLQPDEAILESKVQQGDALDAYQDELQKLMQENDAIVASAEGLLQSLLPEVEEELPEETREALEEMLEEMAQEETDSETAPALDSPEAVRERIEELERTAGQKTDEAKSSLEDALAEMKQAESGLDEMIAKATKEQQEELPKEQLSDAKDLVAAAATSIAGESEELEQRLAQAAKDIEEITRALAATIEVDGELAEKGAAQPQGHTSSAVEALKSAQDDMQAAAEAAAMAAKLSEMMGGANSSTNQQIAKQQILETLARAEAGTHLDLTRQMKGQDLDVAPESVRRDQHPPPIGSTFKGTPGRKLVKQGGTPAVWYHVNQWYILGPYDNRGRMNLQRVYPPESAIDLDAHYLGKSNANLSWAYDSFAEQMVNPSTGWGEYTIYYGFTELFFEEACDLWIAVGSDDRSDLWINDMPVWHSSNELKIWRVGEGFRKVHFKKGRNKVVFRLENGWQQLGFSLLINATGSN